MNILEAKSISKSFKSNNVNNVIFEDLDFSIQKSAFTSIQGASGVGKSTLLYNLSTIDRPDSGEIFLNTDSEQFNLNKLSDKRLSIIRNKFIGFIFQFHHLLPEFTALENVMMPSLIHNESVSIAKDNAKNLLDIVGVSNRINSKPQELSGGEQQRVAIARALINKPLILFADEPTGNLDEKNSAAVLELIINLKNEFDLTFFVATHSKEAANLADVKLMMTQGHIEKI